MFKLKNRPQWYTVGNRSKTYVEKIVDKISGEHFKNYNISKVVRNYFDWIKHHYHNKGE